MDDNFLNKFVECYAKKCKKEIKKKKKLTDKLLKDSGIIYKNYSNNKFDKNELTKKLTDLNKKYANDIKDLYQCQLDKCNELTKIKIEKMIKNLSYAKKDNYSIDDYLKIIELYDIYKETFLN